MKMSEREARIGIIRCSHWTLDGCSVDDIGMPSEVTMKNEANPYLPEIVKLYPERECEAIQDADTGEDFRKCSICGNALMHISDSYCFKCGSKIAK